MKVSYLSVARGEAPRTPDVHSRRMAGTAAGPAPAGRAGSPRRPAGGARPDPRSRRGRPGRRRGGLGQGRVVRQPRRAGQTTLGRLHGGQAHGAHPGGPGVPGGRDPARRGWRGERRDPARAAHVRPDLAHDPPQCRKTGALVPGAPDPCSAAAGPGLLERPRRSHRRRRRGVADRVEQAAEREVGAAVSSSPHSCRAAQEATMSGPHGQAPIVVGVDASEDSKDASRWAERHAQITDATLEVITAWHLPIDIGTAWRIPATFASPVPRWTSPLSGMPTPPSCAVIAQLGRWGF